METTELDDEQRALIPKPLNELTIHCAIKGIQLGSTVTLITALPYQLYKSKKNLSLIPILSRVGKISIYGSFVGVALSLGMMHAKLYKENYNEYRIWDRSYRLRHSVGQNRADQFSFYSSIIGGTAGFFIGLPKKYHPISFGKGALLSIPFGLLAHIITASTKK